MDSPAAPPPDLSLADDGYPAPSGIARRPAGAAESVRANRRWWDAAAPAYLAEHGGDLGDADFLWCPEGLREAEVHLLGEVAGRRGLDRKSTRLNSRHANISYAGFCLKKKKR